MVPTTVLGGITGDPAGFAAVAVERAGAGDRAGASDVFLLRPVLVVFAGASTAGATAFFAPRAVPAFAAPVFVATAFFAAGIGAFSAVFRCVGFFAVTAASVAGFSGKGLRALLDGAFVDFLLAVLVAGVVDFAVFFVVNL